MIVYNSPDHVKERQNVKPLTLEQENLTIELLNQCITLLHGERFATDAVQRFVWNYENMKNHIASCPNNIINNFEVKL